MPVGQKASQLVSWISEDVLGVGDRLSSGRLQMSCCANINDQNSSHSRFKIVRVRRNCFGLRSDQDREVHRKEKSGNGERIRVRRAIQEVLPLD